MQDGENPGPLIELAYWKERAKNLNSINQQLNGPRITKVITISIS